MTSSSTTTSYFYTVEKFYSAFQPNITTTKNGIVYFNSNDKEEDNAFPQKLQDSYRKSAVHSNFINLKANWIYGSGLFSKGDNPELDTFIESINEHGESVDTIYQKCAFDMAMFEAACLQVIYNAEGQIAEIYHTCPANIRAEEPDEAGRINNWYYSTTWGDITNKRNKKKRNNVSEAEVIPAFNPKTGVRDKRQLLYIKRYSATNDIYVQPQYTSSFNFIELEHTLSDYLVNKVIGGWYPSGIMYFPSNMSKEEQEQYVREFRSKHEGTDNAGKIIFIFGDTTVSKPEFVKLNDDLGNSLVSEFISTAQLQIAISHGGSMSLLGIDRGSQSFGTNADANQLNVSRLYFIDSVISHYQSTLLKGFNKVLAVNNLGKVSVNNDSLKLQQPLIDLNDLTRDERREIVFGLPPISTGTTATTNVNLPTLAA